MAEMKFEDGMKKLEKIVEDLEEGNIPLEEALEKYEEGIRLSKLCTKKLEAAKKKVEILLKSEDGGVELAPFDEKAATEDKPVAEPKKRKVKSAEGEGLF